LVVNRRSRVFFSGVKYTCEHRFGSQASGNDMGYSPYSACVSATPNTQLQCSIDANGQVRLGFAAQLLAQAQEELEGIQGTHSTLIWLAIGTYTLAGCCCLMACVSIFQLCSSSERSVSLSDSEDIEEEEELNDDKE